MTLPTLHITADHIKGGVYIGPDVSNYEGHIEIDANLGWVKFEFYLCATGCILAEAGTGIKAGDGIKAGEGIKAGMGIEAGKDIEASFSIRAKWISAKLRIFAGLVNGRLPKNGEDEIHAQLRSGTIAFGKHIAPIIDTHAPVSEGVDVFPGEG